MFLNHENLVIRFDYLVGFRSVLAAKHDVDVDLIECPKQVALAQAPVFEDLAGIDLFLRVHVWLHSDPAFPSLGLGHQVAHMLGFDYSS